MTWKIHTLKYLLIINIFDISGLICGGRLLLYFLHLYCYLYLKRGKFNRLNQEFNNSKLCLFSDSGREIHAHFTSETDSDTKVTLHI